MDELRKIEIYLSPNPRKCTVRLDDQDISGAVLSCVIGKASPTELPTVVLELQADEIEINGEALPIIDRSMEDDGVLALLDSLNPAEIESEALVGAAYGVSPVVKAIEIIKERLHAT
jgi:hypothetical protein